MTNQSQEGHENGKNDLPESLFLLLRFGLCRHQPLSRVLSPRWVVLFGGQRVVPGEVPWSAGPPPHTGTRFHERRVFRMVGIASLKFVQF